MRRFWIPGLAALLVLGIAGAVAAAPAFGWGSATGEPGNGFFGTGFMGWMHGYNSDEAPILDRGLNLTEDQVNTINDLREQHLADMETLREDMFDLRNQYRDAVTSGNTTEADQLRTQLEQAQEQMTELREQNQEQLQQVLTDEQRQQLNDNAPYVDCPMGGLGPRAGAGIQGGRGMGGRGMGGFGHQGF